MIGRYARRALEALEGIDADCADANQKLARYAALYAHVLKDQRTCLGPVAEPKGNPCVGWSGRSSLRQAADACV